MATNAWNEYNYLLDARRAYSGEALEAIAEAMAWLRARALIARKPGDTSEAAIIVTRTGRRVVQDGPQAFYANERLQGGLHHLIEKRVRPQFLIGEYEQGVFVAMKSVEVRVRKLAALPDDVMGVDLMNRAFGPNGPLTDPAQQKSEQEGTRSLFAGAYAVFRNPAGHREVNYDDVAEAAEAVQTASLLMRILDRVQTRLAVIGAQLLRYHPLASKTMKSSPATQLDRTAIQQRLQPYPRLAAIISPGAVAGGRLGAHRILVEWLHQGTHGCMQGVAAVEADLEVLATARLPGYPALAARIATGSRDGVFAMLAEAFVAAWYVRSGMEVVDVHRDEGEGDVLVADRGETAHLEVYDIAGPVDASGWSGAWSELQSHLQLLRLPYFVSFAMPTAWRDTWSPKGIPQGREPIPAPTLTDLAWICKRVNTACASPRREPGWQPPRFRLEEFSAKWPELWVEIVDAPGMAGAIIGSWDGTGGGGGFSPSAMADRILAKTPPTGPGKKVLMVEVSRYTGETFIDQWKRDRVRQKIAANVRSWDAIVAYGRWWDRAEPAQVYVLHLAEGAGALLPAWPRPSV